MKIIRVLQKYDPPEKITTQKMENNWRNKDKFCAIFLKFLKTGKNIIKKSLSNIFTQILSKQEKTDLKICWPPATQE